MKDSALVVVDALYDFIDGSLACANAEKAVEKSLEYIEEQTSRPMDSPDYIQSVFPILFVADHHPADHCSFKSQGGLWPEHCVQGTRGAEIHDALKPYAKEEFTFFKGFNKDVEQYSGFEGINEAGQSLYDVLDTLDIHNVIVSGIATEFCVKNTCTDLLNAGFKVWLLEDGLGWVDRDGHLRALEEMKRLGIRILN